MRVRSGIGMYDTSCGVCVRAYVRVSVRGCVYVWNTSVPNLQGVKTSLQHGSACHRLSAVSALHASLNQLDC